MSGFSPDPKLYGGSNVLPFTRKPSIEVVAEFCDTCGCSVAVRRWETALGAMFRCSQCIQRAAKLDASNSFSADEGPSIA